MSELNAEFKRLGLNQNWIFSPQRASLDLYPRAVFVQMVGSCAGSVYGWGESKTRDAQSLV